MPEPAPTTGEQWAERDRNAVQHPGGGGGADTVVLSHGKGATVWDADGRAYLDAQGGAWFNLVGHGRAELAEAAAEQMARLAHFSIGFDFSSMPATELAEKLIQLAPGNIRRARFMSGGGEADDHALQLVRLHHFRNGQPERRKVLTHRGAYHGGTSGGVELAGGVPGVAGAPDEVIQLTAPRPYHPERYGNRDMTDFCVDELQSVIAEHGPETIAAMFGELVIGPGGMVPLPDDYWPRMTAVLRQHGILFVADEVVTAFGRAGAWFTSNDYGLEPDIIVLAKGIASGYAPLAALLLDGRLADAVDGAGPGSSYAGHNAGCAVASAHLDIIERENLLENSRARGAQFLDELSRLSSHPLVGDIRGRGLMIGVELVADKETRRPLSDVAPTLHRDLPRYVRREHAVLLGMRASAVVLTPPLIVTAPEVSRICEAVADAVNRIDPETFALPA